jgi:hypothetical protein
VPSESNAGPPRPWRCFAAASAFAALAACAGPVVPPPPDPPVVADPAPDVGPAQADDPAPPPPPGLDSSPAARAARLAGRPPPAPGIGRDAPVRLIGLAREFVLELLGPAGFVRRDGPVQIWRYSGDDCFLDVFLFRESDAFRVNHVEARSKNSSQVSVDGCYRALVAARRAG